MTIRELTYREAIIAGLADAMREDPKVLLIGEDIGEAGGVFKTTAGLFEEFGPTRVRDTPISETAFVGAALGLATTGYRPVVEIMFADFLGVCFDQVVNSIAKHRFMSGGKKTAPLVIRTACGGGIQFGAQHSQTAESWLLPFPGLKLLAPSRPQEAYGMIRAAVRDDNPVVVFEHKALFGRKEPVTLGDAGIAAISGPAVLRAGRDVSVVATLAMVARALEAAERLAAHGIETEVIDLRVLRPLDSAPIVASVRRTGRLLTVEEQPALGGWGSAVVAEVAEAAFAALKAPPRRVAMADHPLPFSAPLEAASIPSVERIEAAIRTLVGS